MHTTVPYNPSKSWMLAQTRFHDINSPWSAEFFSLRYINKQISYFMVHTRRAGSPLVIIRNVFISDFWGLLFTVLVLHWNYFVYTNVVWIFIERCFLVINILFLSKNVNICIFHFQLQLSLYLPLFTLRKFKLSHFYWFFYKYETSVLNIY